MYIKICDYNFVLNAYYNFNFVFIYPYLLILLGLQQFNLIFSRSFAVLG